jgi:class 3 adenylate cyclase
LAGSLPIGKIRSSSLSCGTLRDARGRIMAETRKIAAILVADVVGYSRLAGALISR